jgi:CubicO group peptidase (beta-lactamase class C family)
MNRGTPFRFAMPLIMSSVLGSGYCLSQPSREEVAARIDEYLNTQVAAGQFMGSVLVADDGEIVISKGYGMANIELGVPNTPVTKFRIASVTKQFTAMAIMILQERGSLNVHDPISMYVPNCPDAWGSITIHHLLTHTSGIPNYTGLPGIYPDYLRTPRTTDETIALFSNLPLRFTPGTRWEYSNSGYVLLGQIIEVVSGESYEDFIRQNIFEPLGMSNSGLDSTRTIIMDRADGYVRENDILLNAIHIEMDGLYAAGALYSTVDDLLLWDQALYTTELVSQPSLDAIFTAHTTTAFEAVAYGYGWYIRRLFNRTVFEHEGDVVAFRAYIGRFPEEGVLIVLLSNLGSSPVGDYGEAIAGIIQETFDPMLLAYWSLDETEGMIAHDSEGDNNATVMGNPLWQPAGGKVGGALQFDGIDDYVTTDPIRDPPEGPFSVFAWVKDGAPGQVVISQQKGANWLMADASQGVLMTELKSTARFSGPLRSRTVITDGDWHHVGLVCDGAKRILYVDEVEDANDAHLKSLGSGLGLYIGAGKKLEVSSYWKGLIDDVRIYDRAVRL